MSAEQGSALWPSQQPQAWDAGCCKASAVESQPQAANLFLASTPEQKWTELGEEKNFEVGFEASGPLLWPPAWPECFFLSEGQVGYKAE